MTDENTQTVPGTLIPLASLPNLRDIGGYATASGGTVRTGVLYRSVALDRLSDADARVLEGFGIRTVFDLRTAGEREAAPDRRLDGARETVCDVLADASGAAPAQMLQLVQDPQAAAAAFGDGKAQRLFEQAYRQIVSSDSALRAYRRFFADLGEAGTVPSLFHCTTGKDRTGWAAASTLLLLGVDEEQVRYDYELTNHDLLPAFQALFDQFAADGGDPAILKPVLGVDSAYLSTALAEMTERFGSIEGYFTDGLGIDPQAQHRLQQKFTV